MNPDRYEYLGGKTPQQLITEHLIDTYRDLMVQHKSLPRSLPFDEQARTMNPRYCKQDAKACAKALDLYPSELHPITVAGWLYAGRPAGDYPAVFDLETTCKMALRFIGWRVLRVARDDLRRRPHRERWTEIFMYRDCAGRLYPRIDKHEGGHTYSSAALCHHRDQVRAFFYADYLSHQLYQEQAAALWLSSRLAQ